jgi:hypothetical protein
MSPDQIVRAWKSAAHDPCLDAMEGLPAHPIGPIVLSDNALDLAGASAQISTEYVETLGCCQGFTQAGKCDVTVGYPWCTMWCLTIAMTAASLCGATT